MGNLQNLLLVTQELTDVLAQGCAYQSRERLIADMNKIIEKRGKVMKTIHPPFTESEQQIGERIVKQNIVIQQHMEQLSSALKTEMKQIQQRKRSNQSYINPYSHVDQIDGMFLDRKN